MDRLGVPRQQKNMVSAWAHRLAVVAALFAAAPAWANEHSDDGKLFDLVCVEWSDGGALGTDGGVQERCVKYETAYGCSTVGPGWLGALALVVFLRKRSAFGASR